MLCNPKDHWCLPEIAPARYTYGVMTLISELLMWATVVIVVLTLIMVGITAVLLAVMILWLEIREIFGLAE